MRDCGITGVGWDGLRVGGEGAGETICGGGGDRAAAPSTIDDVMTSWLVRECVGGVAREHLP